MKPSSTQSNELRHIYRIAAPGTPEHGRMLTFGPATPPMFARDRFTLADGRMVWIEYVGTVAR